MSISPLLSRLHELPVCRVTDMPTAPTILKAKRRRGAGDDHDVEAGLKNQRSVTEATGTSLDPTLFRKNTNQGEDVEDKAWITDASHVNGDKAGPLETNEDAGSHAPVSRLIPLQITIPEMMPRFTSRDLESATMVSWPIPDGVEESRLNHVF